MKGGNLESMAYEVPEFVRAILLLDSPHADKYLGVALSILVVVATFQHLQRSWSRPPTVPSKRLPRRPALQVLFKPEESDASPATNNTTPRAATSTNQSVQTSTTSRRDRQLSPHASDRSSTVPSTVTQSRHAPQTPPPPSNFLSASPQLRRRRRFSSTTDPKGLDSDDVTPAANGNYQRKQQQQAQQHLHAAGLFKMPTDLPDSFAPLLSSNQVDVLRNQLPADLIHAVQLGSEVRLRVGRHVLPLNRDPSRPQLTFDISAPGGCRMMIAGAVGSDSFRDADDLDVTIPTTSRSKTVVKEGSITLDPPLALSNVAPTLVHLPVLFEDATILPFLRRVRFFRMFLRWISSVSSALERILWAIERNACQIHLAKVKVVRIYRRGRGLRPNRGPPSARDDWEQKETSHSPTEDQVGGAHWRLSPSFSGHVLLFGWIPVPFVSVTLPPFIIPHPHALLERLLTDQPLASARLRRENIAERRILLATLDTVESWTADLRAVATPPALEVDWTPPGGITLAVELMHGRDAGGPVSTHRFASNGGAEDPMDSAEFRPLRPGSDHLNRENSSARWANDSAEFNPPLSNIEVESVGGETCTSWGTLQEHNSPVPRKRTASSRRRKNSQHSTPLDWRSVKQGGAPSSSFDANSLVPWQFELSARGRFDHDKVAFTLSKCVARHEGNTTLTNEASAGDGAGSSFGLSGSAVVARAPSRVERSHLGNSLLSEDEEQPPSVCAVLLFPEDVPSLSTPSPSCKGGGAVGMNLLHYDFAFDVAEDTRIDAVSLSVGASHPMLRGGTMVTTVLESIYSYGSLAAREGAVFDPREQRRKRNILLHLPAVDITAGIQNVYIPEHSLSYSDDGQTKCFHELDGGRMMIRITGGFNDGSGEEKEGNGHAETTDPQMAAQFDGIKVVTDFGVSTFALHNETNVNEFPEFDIFEGSKLFSLLSGMFSGRISAHLRRQELQSKRKSGIGPNAFNPLEAYELDFSGSNGSLRIKEASATLGHRRIIIPTETTFTLTVLHSVMDMAMEGVTDCEVSWDFQGLSPILQVTSVGQSPVNASHENRDQVSLLISALRQGRLNFHVSPVGGIQITQAKTLRENREGLYDWKFFNALVSPDQESPARLVQVLHDRPTMNKLLQVSKLINADLEKICRYVLTQVWRAKEIFDREGVSEPGKAIPGHKMSRLVSLFLCEDINQVDEILPVIRRIVAGEGLDVVKVKELLRTHLEGYDEWAPEIDRVVRWATVMLGPMTAAQVYVETDAPPLSQLPRYKNLFVRIPSAREIYLALQEKGQLPLDMSFSNMLCHIAPYMTFRQVEYLLRARQSTDWRPDDLRRLRYVYSVKKKVLEISESYGGLTFLPQSFYVSVFLGEATRASLRTSGFRLYRSDMSVSELSTLRRRKRTAHQSSYLNIPFERSSADENDVILSPAARVASVSNFMQMAEPNVHDHSPQWETSHQGSIGQEELEEYEMGDSLLGPQDVAILLQAGLTSSMKSSTVVQLNQRMLLDLMASQPRSFSVAVLAEIGSPGGHGSARALSSALMALLELDQSSFTTPHRLDMHALLESWLPGLTIPRREDYLAGGRWARQSYYEAIFGVAKSILEDAESYMALKGHLQRVRHHGEGDPIPMAKELAPKVDDLDIDAMSSLSVSSHEPPNAQLTAAIEGAMAKIAAADQAGIKAVSGFIGGSGCVAESKECETVIAMYREAFEACAQVLKMDKLAFTAGWFKDFYRRNYDALMVMSVYGNVVDDIDHVRAWLDALRREGSDDLTEGQESVGTTETSQGADNATKGFFKHPEEHSEQEIIDRIVDVLFYDEQEKEAIRNDPLVRLLIPNPPGDYNFSIVSAMGVITEGKKGLELAKALERIEEQRGVITIKADTGTVRSFEFNASKIEEAIEAAAELKKPFGLIGYSQGCANSLMAESLLFSGTPTQQRLLTSPETGLVCRQLLFSAANGSMHGPATDMKAQRLIVMCEEFFKYQQGYFSRAFTSAVLEFLNSIMDSAQFQKLVGGVQSMLPDGCLVFWREAQHLPHVPTCVLRGVMESHTTPESLEMISNLLTKQSGSALHDSQVHVYDAVGYPVHAKNRNGKVLSNCNMGGAIQRTHHWSPLCEEVELVKTKRDDSRATFECAKDRHVFPWVDVNVRFGIIKYVDTWETSLESPEASQQT